MARAGWDLGSTASPRYTKVAIALHWLIAIAILYNLTSGLAGSLLPRGFFVFHVSSGITILVLSILRVLWRLTHRPPPLLLMATWEKGAAHTVHFLLYVAMLLLPFSGWAMVSANPPAGSPGAAYADAQRAAHQPPPPPGQPAPPPRKRSPIMVWGLFKLPLIKPVNEIGRTPDGVSQQHDLHERIETFHLIGGWIMLALLVLHIGGALKHQLVDRQPELARMGLGGGRRRLG